MAAVPADRGQSAKISSIAPPARRRGWPARARRARTADVATTALAPRNNGKNAAHWSSSIRRVLSCSCMAGEVQGIGGRNGMQRDDAGAAASSNSPAPASRASQSDCGATPRFSSSTTLSQHSSTLPARRVVNSSVVAVPIGRAAACQSSGSCWPARVLPPGRSASRVALGRVARLRASAARSASDRSTGSACCQPMHCSVRQAVGDKDRLVADRAEIAQPVAERTARKSRSRWPSAPGRPTAASAAASSHLSIASMNASLGFAAPAARPTR